MVRGTLVGGWVIALRGSRAQPGVYSGPPLFCLILFLLTHGVAGSKGSLRGFVEGRARPRTSGYSGGMFQRRGAVGMDRPDEEALLLGRTR